MYIYVYMYVYVHIELAARVRDSGGGGCAALQGMDGLQVRGGVLGLYTYMYKPIYI